MYVYMYICVCIYECMYMYVCVIRCRLRRGSGQPSGPGGAQRGGQVYSAEDYDGGALAGKHYVCMYVCMYMGYFF